MKNTYKKTVQSESASKEEKPKNKKGINFSPKIALGSKSKTIVGLVFLFASLAFLLSFTSFLFTGNADQSILLAPLGELNDENSVQNWLGMFGAVLAQKFIGDWFGISAFSFILILFLIAFKLLLGVALLPLKKVIKYSLFLWLWLPAFLGYFFDSGKLLFLGGGIGQTLNVFLYKIIGSAGSFMLILFSALAFVVVNFNISMQKLIDVFAIQGKEPIETDALAAEGSPENNLSDEDELEGEPAIEIEEAEPDLIEDFSDKNTHNTILNTSNEVDEQSTNTKAEISLDSDFEITIAQSEESTTDEVDDEDELGIEIEVGQNEETLEEDEIKKRLAELGEYDPKLDLPNFQLPSIDLLEHHGDGEIKINREELEANKNRIVETLKNYKIGIAQIKATVGPTVTLYEIVPEAGVRISKIKNLEDDIALSLSALGIRIIAPIPGKGTIGIEVPNQNADVVSMKALIASEKFQNTKMALPIAIGKTINNEIMLADLAKMPHLLMAGATGQGKSVGLNAILVSLLYKLHPSQIKFVLVDPKKVELTLFNKIERHYLAKLPDTEEAIITDTTKVVHTLNSLCIEMDQRYELLKNALVRNLSEYNVKFKARKLNPENGHRFLPYIVVVIDEFADLIMTAGKEVETPIARLAQLARAIGIHLIIATQRPSVNVITGIIKANFPARIAFRVTSKIDSRTILDSGGADQLIGRGDMLISLGSDLIRVQCGFVDTPEVEKICDFIGNQKAYPSALLLPEYVDESGGGGSTDFEDMDKDVMFEEAARIVVQNQQGSTSLIQRRLKLGYNRAGRIVDQLEAAGVLGPFEGSKARQVLIPDEFALEQFLQNLNNKDNQ